MATPILKHKKKIAIVDDHSLFRAGFSRLIQQITEHDIIFEAENGKELIEKLNYQKPDLIFLDLEMPIMNGIDAAVFIKTKFPEIKVIILSMHFEEELIDYLTEKGVNGFLTKNADLEIVLKALHSVCTIGYYKEDYNSNKVSIQDELSMIKTQQTFSRSNLSIREIEVIKLMCKQYTNREIANILCISPRTVDTYRENIFMKTKSKNIAGVVLYAIKHKIWR